LWHRCGKRQSEQNRAGFFEGTQPTRQGEVSLAAWVIVLAVLYSSSSPQDPDIAGASPKSPPALLDRLRSWLGL
jgi:hypothetical protein